ncbi:MAG: NosD domain-containing protein [Ignavibacteria bacterium]
MQSISQKPITVLSKIIRYSPGADRNFSGNGIHLWKCSYITMEYNETAGHRDGFYLEFVTKGTMTGNYSHNNLRYGLHFMFSDSNVYKENLFRENGAGGSDVYKKH